MEMIVSRLNGVTSDVTDMAFKNLTTLLDDFVRLYGSQMSSSEFIVTITIRFSIYAHELCVKNKGGTTCI